MHSKFGKTSSASALFPMAPHGFSQFTEFQGPFSATAFATKIKTIFLQTLNGNYVGYKIKIGLASYLVVLNIKYER